MRSLELVGLISAADQLWCGSHKNIDKEAENDQINKIYEKRKNTENRCVCVQLNTPDLLQWAVLGFVCSRLRGKGSISFSFLGCWLCLQKIRYSPRLNSFSILLHSFARTKIRQRNKRKLFNKLENPNSETFSLSQDQLCRGRILSNFLVSKLVRMNF